MAHSSSPESVQSVSQKTVSDVKESVRQVYMTNLDSADADVSFLSLMNDLKTAPMTLNAVVEFNDNELVTVTNEDMDAKAARKTEKPKRTVKVDQGNSVSDPVSAISKSSEKDIQEAKDDMLLLDARLLDRMDFQILNQLCQTPCIPNGIQNFSPSLLEQLPQTYYKSLNGSKALQNMLDNAYKTQRPIRLDLTDQASIILRLGRDGRVSAEFLPADQAAAFFFQHNLQDLKDRLDAKQLPYGELLVKNWKDQPQQNQKQKQ